MTLTKMLTTTPLTTETLIKTHRGPIGLVLYLGSLYDSKMPLVNFFPDTHDPYSIHRRVARKEMLNLQVIQK